MNQRKAGAILSYVGFFISNIVGIVYTPIMLQLMGQSEYGLYGTASSLTSYLSLLSFGIGGAYLRYSSRYRAANDIEGERRLNGAFLLIFSVISVLVLICGAGLIVFSEHLVENTFTTREMQRMQIIMALGIVNMVITFLFSAVSMTLQAYERYIFIRVVHLIAAICNPIINLIVLYSGGRAVALSVVSLSISVVSFGIYYIYAWKELNFRMSASSVFFFRSQTGWRSQGPSAPFPSFPPWPEYISGRAARPRRSGSPRHNPSRRHTAFPSERRRSVQGWSADPAADIRGFCRSPPSRPGIRR